MTVERESSRGHTKITDLPYLPVGSRDNPIILADESFAASSRDKRPVMGSRDNPIILNEEPHLAQIAPESDAPVPRFSHRRKRGQSPERARIAKRHCAVGLQVQACAFCFEDVNLEEFANTQCSHQSVICRSCFGSSIVAQLRTTGSLTLSCPVSNCGRHLDLLAIQNCMSHKSFTQAEERMFRHWLAASPDFQECIARGCSSGQLHEGSNPLFYCTACRFSHCVRHKVPWHEGITCEQYEVLHPTSQEELASYDTINSTSQQCPGCGLRIEKIDGCNHMTCTRCRHEFCWLCLATVSYSVLGRMRHRVHCPLFRSRRS